MGAQPYSGISFQSEKWIQPEQNSGEDEPSRQKCSCQRSNLDADANQALLHVIELLWKENKELRNQIIEKDNSKGSGAESSHRLINHGAIRKTFEVEKANSKAGKREATCRASPNNQCNNYADVCKRNILVKEDKSQKN